VAGKVNGRILLGGVSYRDPVKVPHSVSSKTTSASKLAQSCRALLAVCIERDKSRHIVKVFLHISQGRIQFNVFTQDYLFLLVSQFQPFRQQSSTDFFYFIKSGLP